ncbi:MAG: DUF5519 family protein [Actinomycetota bacterium]|nr:DUF5519 family protein [Actinomycetota bacterium]
MTTIAPTSAARRITEEVTAWPGVTAGQGRRGELAFHLGRREIGHLHGDRSAHFSFPKDLWRELHAEGRITEHPVFPGREGPAARAIASDDDVLDVIALLRLNYERALLRHPLAGIVASEPHPLPFAPDLVVRTFVLEREQGNVLVYGAPDVPRRDVARWYLNHRHEAMFPPAAPPGAPLFVHEDDRVEGARATFSRRHTLDGDFEVIPTPGHTPGATAYLWDSGEQRFLFTGDTIYLDDGSGSRRCSSRATAPPTSRASRSSASSTSTSSCRGRPRATRRGSRSRTATTRASASTGSSSACATAARARSRGRTRRTARPRGARRAASRRRARSRCPGSPRAP